jgi:hypothetical protein
MKIARVEHLHADAGQRNFDFLKISTDDGLVGWSEYNESFGGLGVSAVIDGLSSQIVGADPRAYEAIVTRLYAVRRQAAGGVVQQAIGWACPCTRCWADRCAIGFAPTGRTARRTGCPGGRTCSCRRSRVFKIL